MKIARFIAILIPCTILRFYLGEDTLNFLWFAVLYLPLINWLIYWTMFTTRVGLNRLKGEEWISVARVRSVYVWYLNIPGSLAVAELIYRGYVFNT